MTPTTTQSRPSETPATRDATSESLLKQLLALRVDQHVELAFQTAQCRRRPTPDFHTDDTTYRVLETRVSKTSDGEESYFHILLGSADVQSTTDPVLKITVSRNVSEKIGVLRDDAEWTRHWVMPRTGRSYGSPDWGTQRTLESITVLSDVPACPECGRPF